MGTKHVFTKVEVKDLKAGQVVSTSLNEHVPYLVLDVGHPFILLENLTTHWAGLYHPVDGLYILSEVEDDAPSTNNPQTEETSQIDETTTKTE